MRESQRRVIGITALVVLLVALSWLSIAKLRSASRLGWAGMTYLPIVGSKKAPKPMIGVSPGSVVLVYPGSPASRAGIDRGDEVVAINGIPASDVPRLTTLNAATRAGDVLTYTIRRNGTTRDVGVRLESPVRSPAILVSLTVNVFVALTFLIIGFFVFLRRPSDARVVVFYTMTLIAAASFVSTGFSQIDSSNTRGIAVQPTIGSFAGSLSIAVTAAFFAPLLLHLALIFPLERPVLKRRRRLVFQWIYGFPIALSIVIAGVVLIYAIVSRATPAN